MIDSGHIHKQLDLSYACKTHNYTTIDIETTGLSPTDNEIIELAATRIRDGQLEEVFQSFVKPIKKISTFVSNLIDDKCNDSAYGYMQSLYLAIVFIGLFVSIIESTNLHTQAFKYGLINCSTSSVWNILLYSCIIILKFSCVRSEFGISNSCAHRALGDACATYECFELMKNELIQKRINIDDLQIYQHNNNKASTRDFYRLGNKPQYVKSGVELDHVDRIVFENSRFTLTGECKNLTIVVAS